MKSLACACPKTQAPASTPSPIYGAPEPAQKLAVTLVYSSAFASIVQHNPYMVYSVHFPFSGETLHLPNKPVEAPPFRVMTARAQLNL